MIDIGTRLAALCYAMGVRQDKVKIVLPKSEWQAVRSALLFQFEGLLVRDDDCRVGPDEFFYNGVMFKMEDENEDKHRGDRRPRSGDRRVAREPRSGDAGVEG